MNTNQANFRWKIAECHNGFTVSAPGNTPVRVEIVDGCRLVVFAKPGEEVDTATHGLYEFYSLQSSIVDAANLCTDRDEWPKYLKAWGRKKTGKVINAEVHAQWKKLLDKVDPIVRDTQRSAYAATQKCPKLLFKPHLYKHTYLIKDVRNYPAAAKFLLLSEDKEQESDFLRWMRTDEAQQFKAALMTFGVENPTSTLRDIYRKADKAKLSTVGDDYDPIVDYAANWRGALSATGKPYSSLNKTIDAMPNNIPSNMIAMLANGLLERPITDRTELLALLTIRKRRNSHYFGEPEHMASLERIVMHATRAQIVESLRRTNRYLHQDWKHTRAADMYSFFVFLADYPEVHTGNIVGLTDKCIDWHRYAQEKKAEEKIGQYGVAKEVKLPPVDVPAAAGVRLLATVGDIVDEAKLMGHCVASYIDKAIYGRCYLFHVDHVGELATVEVDPYDRKVVQSQGPHNQKNTASEWGKRVLSRWAKSLPDQPVNAVPF